MKRYRLIPSVVLAMLLFVGLQACDSGFEDMNRNPNEPETVPPEYILPRAQQTMMDRLYSMSGMNGYIGSVFAQGYAKIQYVDEDKYDFAGRLTLFDNIWQSFYTTTMEDLRQVAVVGAETGNSTVEGIAEILLAYNFHLMTDLWGDIPYSEALDQEAPQPRYDSQADVYDGLINDLNEAIGKLNTGQSAFGSSDLIYGGNVDNWIRFANSLKLRIAMRMSFVNQSEAAGIIQDVYNDGRYIASHDQNAEFNYLQYPYNNPVNEFARTRIDHKVSRTTVTALQELDDPRLRIYATPVQSQDLRDAGTVYQGVRNGDVNNSLPLGEASTMGHYFVAPTSPGFLMTYDEVLFIFAEAAARGMLSADAEQLYNEAVTAALEKYSPARVADVLGAFSSSDVAFQHQGFRAEESPEGITQDEIDAYLSQPEVQWDSSQWRQRIGLQKWLSLYGQGFQQWSEWRRLGVPELQPGPEAVLDEVPRRVPYPDSEDALNKTNLDEARSRLGGDTFLTRLWWDPN